MKFKSVAITVLAIIALGVADASAQSPFSHAVTKADPKMKTSVVSYSATATTTLQSSAMGSCDTSSYVLLCGSGDCACSVLTGTIAGSKIGKGVVEIDVTSDIGLGLPNGVCDPIYADALISASKDDEILFFNGDVCTGVSDVTFGQGGFALDDSTLFIGAVGKVTVSNEKNSTTIFKWTFKGQAAP
jgi:hypothetical protein